jgi:LuxR family quorum-sensing system transcriptional regulator CciR
MIESDRVRLPLLSGANKVPLPWSEKISDRDVWVREDRGVTLPDWIAPIRIASVGEIRRAAFYFSDTMMQLARLRIAATDNIAARVPMLDGAGALLATTAFGWDRSTSQWWANPSFALRTPHVEACRIESQPFWANATGAWNERGEPVLEGADFSYFGKMVTHPASIVVPVHLPFSRIGMVSFSCAYGTRSDFSVEIREHFHLIYVLSHLFIEDYARLARTDKWLPRWASLTPMEVSCLRWVGRGKTDDEVAAIMGRARPTIRFHVRNATQKLGAVNRAQAVFLAAQLGFLSAPSRLSPHIAPDDDLDVADGEMADV